MRRNYARAVTCRGWAGTHRFAARRSGEPVGTMRDPRKGRPEAYAEVAESRTPAPIVAPAVGDRASEERLQRASERVAHVGSWVWFPRAGVLTWSDGMRRILGVGREVTPTKAIFLAAVHPDDRSRIADLTARAFAERWPSYEAVFRVQWPDGAVRRCQTYAEVRLAPAGAPWRVIGTTWDVTDRAAEESGVPAGEPDAEHLPIGAEAAVWTNDDLLAAVSHELRTALAPARALAQLLAGHASLSPEQRETAAEIERHIAREVRLVDDRLDLERVERGTLTVRPTATDLHEQVRRAVTECAVAALHKGLTMVERLDADDAVVWADPARLRQAVQEIVRSATQSTRAGDRITLRTTNPEAGVVALEHDGASPAAARTAEPTYTPDTRAGAQPDDMVPLRILLVEDHAETARAMVRLLRSHGHSLRHAGSVADAERLAADESFDVFVCDMQLPDGTGVDFLARVRLGGGRNCESAAIAISGYDSESDVEGFQAAGFAAHLTKPADERDLLAAIQQATANPPRAGTE
jgi:signal transduction histidine kinase/ActR/RegA family two-component response regulator